MWPCHYSGGQSPDCHLGRSGSVPGHCVWDLWWTNLLQDGVFFQAHWFSPVSIIPLLPYHNFFIYSATVHNRPGFPRSYTDTLHSVGLLWTNDQPDPEASTWHHTTLTRETSVRPAGFEPAIPTSEQPQTHASDRADIEVCTHNIYKL